MTEVGERTDSSISLSLPPSLAPSSQVLQGSAPHKLDLSVFSHSTVLAFLSYLYTAVVSIPVDEEDELATLAEM